MMEQRLISYLILMKGHCAIDSWKINTLDKKIYIICRLLVSAIHRKQKNNNTNAQAFVILEESKTGIYGNDLPGG